MGDQPFDEGGDSIGQGRQMRATEQEWVMPPDPPLPPTCRTSEPWVDTWTEQRADGKPDGGVSWPVSAMLTVSALLALLGLMSLFVLVAIL